MGYFVNRKDLEESGRDPIDALSLHLRGGTEKNSKISAWPVSRTRFEPSTSPIGVHSATATVTRPTQSL